MTKENKKPLELKSVSRRKAVKQIVGGVSALAAYNMLPVRWEKPIIEQIFLPAHAAVSGITLSDPCTAELVSGNQESSIDVIRVSGFVTPPVGGLEVTIEGTPNGGSGGPVTVSTTTGSDGTYSVEVTMVGGPGIIGVGATTTVAGVNSAAHCSVGIPPADHPSAQRPQPTPSAVIGDFNFLCFIGDKPYPIGVEVPITVNNVAIYTFTVENLDASGSPDASDSVFYDSSTTSLPRTVSISRAINVTSGNTIRVTVTNDQDSQVVNKSAVSTCPP